jgi:hypothetical protein
VRRKPVETKILLRLPVALLIALAVSVASGCGSNTEQFSSGESKRALAALGSIEAAVEDGRCETAQRLVSRLVAQASHVNDDRPELGEAWAGSVARLSNLVQRDCVEISATEPTGPTTTETGPTETVEEPVTPQEPVTPSTPDPPVDNGTDQTPADGGAGGQDDTTTPDGSGGAGPGT